MAHFLNFVISQWQLWLALVIVVTLIISLEVHNRVFGPSRLSPQEVTNLINRHQALVVDVREETLFHQGHIAGALNIPVRELKQKLEKLSPHKGTPVIMVCNAGQSAIKAAVLLKQNGFSLVHVLHGGLNAWKKANLPVIKASKGVKHG